MKYMIAGILRIQWAPLSVFFMKSQWKYSMLIWHSLKITKMNKSNILIWEVVNQSTVQPSFHEIECMNGAL